MSTLLVTLALVGAGAEAALWFDYLPPSVLIDDMKFGGLPGWIRLVLFLLNGPLLVLLAIWLCVSLVSVVAWQLRGQERGSKSRSPGQVFIGRAQRFLLPWLVGLALINAYGPKAAQLSIWTWCCENVDVRNCTRALRLAASSDEERACSIARDACRRSDPRACAYLEGSNPLGLDCSRSD